MPIRLNEAERAKIKEAGRLPRVRRSTLPPKYQEYHDQLVGVPERDPKWPEGNLDGIFDILMHSPETAKMFDEFGRWVRRGATSRQTLWAGPGDNPRDSMYIPTKLEEMTTLLVSRETNCNKLWHAQYWPAVFLGLSEKSAAIIRTYGDVNELEPDEVNIAKFVQQMVRTRTATDETFAAVREQLGDPGIVDLMVLVGFWLTFCLVRLTIKENMIEAAPLQNGAPLMEVPPEFELPPLPPELDRGHTREFYHWQDRGHPELVGKYAEKLTVPPGKVAVFKVNADAHNRVDGYFMVDGAERGVDYAIKGVPLRTSANNATGVKKLRSFAFFAPAKSDFAFEFKNDGSAPASIALNVNVRTR